MISRHGFFLRIPQSPQTGEAHASFRRENTHSQLLGALAPGGCGGTAAPPQQARQRPGPAAPEQLTAPS